MTAPDRAAFKAALVAWRHALCADPHGENPYTDILAIYDALRAERGYLKWLNESASVLVAERDAARRELCELTCVGDTLSPQEIINHCANGLGVDRHDYPGDPEIRHRSIIELNSALKTVRAERDAAERDSKAFAADANKFLRERDDARVERDAAVAEWNELRLAIDSEMRKTTKAHAEVAALTADNERLLAACEAALKTLVFCKDRDELSGYAHEALDQLRAALAPRETP